jgi:hypothetical protein
MDHLRRHLCSHLPSAREEIGERREVAIVYQRIPLVETVTCSKDRRLERPAMTLLWAWPNHFPVQASRRIISRVISHGELLGRRLQRGELNKLRGAMDLPGGRPY